ncbi:DNA-processing protein DprA [Mariprofundus sp. KV]|uniref:DNA-processing protein DprA n=1 Tax=Mariprofundus sp. KV TaxID=2608715 RepID=UPI00322085F0
MFVTPGKQARLWLRLSLVRGAGPMLGHRLVDAVGGIEALWQRDSETLANIDGIGPALLRSLQASSAESVASVIDQCEREQLILLCPDDAAWPKALIGIDDAPLILFVKGDVNVLNSEKRLAVVGARRASREGALIARRWSRSFSDHAITTISGMAYGIDAAVHGGSLEGLSPTIAVLGCGLSALNETQRVQVEAICRQGCVISEFLPLQSARPEQFPRRNRIIAALAQATLVIEADLRSGSLITARCAANYGREVLAVPGSVLSSSHAGCHQLIQDGALLAQDPQSVMQQLGWQGGQRQAAAKLKQFQPGSENEAKIVEILRRESLYLDELTETCGLTLPELSPILLALELQGVIERLPGSRYQLSAE